MSNTDVSTEMTAIREILSRHARLNIDLNAIEETLDLYSCGLTSLATVGIMLALEDHFEVEFPESMLGRETFRSLASIQEALDELQG